MSCRLYFGKLQLQLLKRFSQMFHKCSTGLWIYIAAALLPKKRMAVECNSEKKFRKPFLQPDTQDCIWEDR